MKYRGIHRPKKAKKVTLARIREIVREEFERIDQTPTIDPDLAAERMRKMPGNWSEISATCQGPPGIRPISPPPLVRNRVKIESEG